MTFLQESSCARRRVKGLQCEACISVLQDAMMGRQRIQMSDEDAAA